MSGQGDQGLKSGQGEQGDQGLKSGQSVVLVGPRGAGKSTLALALADHLGFACADTDDLLAAKVGTAAGRYLEAVGERAFREAEEEVVVGALAANSARVLALGGGAVLSQKTRDHLARDGHFVVFLFAPVPILIQRLESGPFRPSLTLLTPSEEVDQITRERAPLYRSVCHLELDTYRSNVTACVRSIVATMGPSDR